MHERLAVHCCAADGLLRHSRTQGQWWSILSTHLLQMLQWWQRMGLMTSQCRQCR